MTDLTPSSAQDATRPDLSQVLLRLDSWLTTLEQAGDSEPSEMPQVVTHLQTIADQTQRTADTLMALTDPQAPLKAMAERMAQLEAQNTALVSRMDQLLARMNLLCNWLGAPPQQTVAQR